MTFTIAGQQKKKEPTPHGERFAQDYIMQYDKNGHKHLVQNGLRDLQQIIQKDLESCKLQNIYDRCVDKSDLWGRQKNDIDLSEMPETLMDANNMMIRLNDNFQHLPAEIRRYYNQSAEQYIADMNNGAAIWNRAMQELKKEPAKQEAKTEVKEEA